MEGAFQYLPWSLLIYIHPSFNSHLCVIIIIIITSTLGLPMACSIKFYSVLLFPWFVFSFCLPSSSINASKHVRSCFFLCPVYTITQHSFVGPKKIPSDSLIAWGSQRLTLWVLSKTLSKNLFLRGFKWIILEFYTFFRYPDSLTQISNHQSDHT